MRVSTFDITIIISPTKLNIFRSWRIMLDEGIMFYRQIDAALLT